MYIKVKNFKRLKNIKTSQRHTPHVQCIFPKFPGLRPATLLKGKPRHSCFPASFAKFLKTLFLQNTSDGYFFLHSNPPFLF